MLRKWRLGAMAMAVVAATSVAYGYGNRPSRTAPSSSPNESNRSRWNEEEGGAAAAAAGEWRRPQEGWTATALSVIKNMATATTAAWADDGSTAAAGGGWFDQLRAWFEEATRGLLNDPSGRKLL